MEYAIYKYEVEERANKNIREIIKDGISVEHILPQEWKWEWIEGSCDVPGSCQTRRKALGRKMMDPSSMESGISF